MNKQKKEHFIKYENPLHKRRKSFMYKTISKFNDHTPFAANLKLCNSFVSEFLHLVIFTPSLETFLIFNKSLFFFFTALSEVENKLLTYLLNSYKLMKELPRCTH